MHRATGLRLTDLTALDERRPTVNGVERIPQLVRERGEELVLRAVGRFGGGAGGLRLAIEPRVLDGARRVGRDDRREGQVRRAIAPRGFGDRERHRAQGSVMRDERHDDPGLRAEPPPQSEMLGVQRDRVQVGLADTRDEHRLARANHGGHAVRGRGIEPVSGTDLVDERVLRAVDVGAGHAVQDSVVLNQVDGAQIAEHRHGQAGQSRQDPLVVERRTKERAHLGEYSRPSLRGDSRRRHPTSLTREKTLDKQEARKNACLPAEMARAARSESGDSLQVASGKSPTSARQSFDRSPIRSFDR